MALPFLKDEILALLDFNMTSRLTIRHSTKDSFSILYANTLKVFWCFLKKETLYLAESSQVTLLYLSLVILTLDQHYALHKLKHL